MFGNICPVNFADKTGTELCKFNHASSPGFDVLT
jgi:hypothetical protein